MDFNILFNRTRGTLFLGFFLFWPFFVSSQSDDDMVWVVQKSSKLFITGTSNLNKFRCDIPEITVTDTLISFEKAEGNICVFYPNEIKIAVLDFDCGHSLMTRDLNSTLNFKAFPFLKLSFITLQKQNENEKAQTNIWIEISGTKRLVVAEGTYQENSKNKSFNGTKSICLSDFKINAPEKFMGMVKVNDEIQVNFEILFEEIKL